MGDARSTREQQLRELAERLRGMVTDADEYLEALQSLRSLVSAVRLERVETYLFDGILHDANELKGRLTEFLAAIDAHRRSLGLPRLTSRARSPRVSRGAGGVTGCYGGRMARAGVADSG